MEKRLNLIFALFLLFFCLIIIRLFYWQIILSDRLGGLADRQRIATLPVKALRGRIFASDGSPLVINQRAYGLIIEPKKITDQVMVENILSRELDILSSSISARLKDTSLVWIPIAHKLDEKKVESIKKDKLIGIKFMEESKRY
ncbi:hypothetical protein FJY90_03635, partial [Candidatus Gottesmanbacteria bacterium]|nr:hypothetical protein [Candidatus Gottesmanbacteria bacterium]